MIKGKIGTEPVNFPMNKLSLWRDTLEEYASVYGELYAVSDTETTNKTIIGKESGLYERLLEWSICFCYMQTDGKLIPIKDEEGEFICIDEPVNPFLSKNKNFPKQLRSVNDIHAGSTEVNGITLDYLFGESEGVSARPKLKSCAATFDVVHDLCQSLLDFESYKSGDRIINLVFHNASFDVMFLNSECDMYGLPKIESFFAIIDTMELAKKAFFINRMSLDRVYQYGKENYPDLISDVERPVHTALIDSLILIQAYNVIHRKYYE